MNEDGEDFCNEKYGKDGDVGRMMMMKNGWFEMSEEAELEQFRG